MKVLIFLEKFFGSKKEEEKKLFVELMLGLFFLLMTLFLVNAFYLEFWGMACWGLFISGKMRTRGYLVALLLCFFLGVYQHYRVEEHLWLFAIQISMLLSLLMIRLSWEQILAQMSSLQTHRATLLQNLSSIEEEMKRADSFHLQQKTYLQESLEHIQKEVKEKKEKIFSLELILRTLKQSLAEEKIRGEQVLTSNVESERKAALFFYEMEELKKELTLLKEKDPSENLLAELHALREKQLQQEILEKKRQEEEKEQIAILQETLQKISSQKEFLEKEEKNLRMLVEEQNHSMERLREELKNASLHQKLQINPEDPSHSEQARAIHDLQSRYRQLQEQFQEKDAALHETRIKLFTSEEKLAAQQRDPLLLEVPVVEQTLIQEYGKVEEELFFYGEENRHLEEVIGLLSSQIAQLSLPKRRGRKKKDQEVLLAPMCEKSSSSIESVNTS